MMGIDSFLDCFSFSSLDVKSVNLSDKDKFRLSNSIFRIDDRERDIRYLYESKIVLFSVIDSTSIDSMALIRNKIGNLYTRDWSLPILDLGNFILSKDEKKNKALFKDVCTLLVDLDLIPLILSEKEEYLSILYSSLSEKSVSSSVSKTIGFVSPSFEIYEDKATRQKDVLLSTVQNLDKTLRNIIFLAYQGYLINPIDIDIAQKLNFELLSLGKITSPNTYKAEPLLRDSDILYFDINSIKASETLGFYNLNPNGLSSEEACQILRYAGISDRIKFMFFTINLKCFSVSLANESTLNLVSQLYWHIFEGVAFRKKEYPLDLTSPYIVKHFINVDDYETKILFLHSELSDRWWFFLGQPDEFANNRDSNKIISCSVADFIMAENHQLPDRWVINVSKI